MKRIFLYFLLHFLTEHLKSGSIQIRYQNQVQREMWSVSAPDPIYVIHGSRIKPLLLWNSDHFVRWSGRSSIFIIVVNKKHFQFCSLFVMTVRMVIAFRTRNFWLSNRRTCRWVCAIVRCRPSLSSQRWVNFLLRCLEVNVSARKWSTLNACVSSTSMRRQPNHTYPRNECFKSACQWLCVFHSLLTECSCECGPASFWSVVLLYARPRVDR